MKTILLFSLLLASVFSIAQSHDDIYYTNTKVKPLKDRKEFTKIDDRRFENAHSLYFYSDPINNYWDKNSEEKYVYMYFFLQGAKYEPVAKRTTLNLSFVIDRSGSMLGDKIDNTKKALHYAIDQLDKDDMISIIQYNDEVSVVVEPQFVVNKEDLHKKVDLIRADGSTNLCGGMEKGLQYVQNAKSKMENSDNSVNRVILLSDGLANAGITQPKEIEKIAREYYQERNISLTTMGVGADYNENLMTGIANEGGGFYYFIGSAEELPGIFAQEFFGLKNIVAKNSIVDVYFPISQVSIDEVYDFPHTIRDNSVRLKFADIFSEKQTSVLLRFKVKDYSADSLVFRTKLSYTNTISEDSELVLEKTQIIKPTTNKKLLDEGINADAHMGYSLTISSLYMKQAQDLVDNRRFNEASSSIDKGLAVLDEHFRVVIPNPFLENLYAQMKDYKKEIPILAKEKDKAKFSLSQKGTKYYSVRNLKSPKL